MKNAQRSLVKIIKEICHEEGITCQSFSYDWLFRLSKQEKITHILGYHFENNSATAQLICADKCATSDLLLAAGVACVEHVFFMSPKDINYVGVSGNWKRLIDLLNKHGKLVCKSNEGTGGGNVHLVSNHFELERATHTVFTGRTMAVSPFYKIEQEYRIVVLNGRAKLVYSKAIPFVEGDGVSTLRQLLIAYAQTHAEWPLDFSQREDEDTAILQPGEKYHLNWKHNLGQGATPVVIQDESLIATLSSLALQAAKTVNIQFASVDIIKTEGAYLVLEINSGVMMENFSQMSDAHYQIAKSIYREALQSIFQ